MALEHSLLTAKHSNLHIKDAASVQLTWSVCVCVCTAADNTVTTYTGHVWLLWHHPAVIYIHLLCENIHRLSSDETVWNIWHALERVSDAAV